MKQKKYEQWRFTALDTLFFKESRPMEAIGGAQLQSVFPPPARTLIGTIRTAIGEELKVDWHAYAREHTHPLRTIMGDAHSLGPLAFVGPYLLKGKERVYAVPQALLEVEIDSKKRYSRLRPSSTMTACDLGAVQLAEKSDPLLLGAKPLENAVITLAGLSSFLEGGLPSSSAIHPNTALFHSEERLGIARDNAKRITGDGMLYQTRHVRPMQDVAIGITVSGLDQQHLPEKGTSRLGAEGRLASWQREAPCFLPPVKINSQQILLVLLTPARFRSGWLPDGLSKVITADKQTVWEGTLYGVNLRLLCAVVGKSVREGGWDMVAKAPRPMDSLVPAGSCYFCEVLAGDANALHGQQLGLDQEYGRGEIAIGNW